MGSNGSGKSTLLQALIGEGRLYLPDTPPLKPLLSVQQHLTYWAALCRFPMPEEVLALILNTWGLTAKQHHPTHQLSFGQQQRLHLCRLSMGLAYRVWLLDEPLTGLDEHYQQTALNVLNAHTNSGGAVLAATHHHSVLQKGERRLCLQDTDQGLPTAQQTTLANW
jgi:heme exporter protein A